MQVLDLKFKRIIHELPSKLREHLDGCRSLPHLGHVLVCYCSCGMLRPDHQPLVHYERQDVLQLRWLLSVLMTKLV